MTIVMPATATGEAGTADYTTNINDSTAKTTFTLNVANARTGKETRPTNMTYKVWKQIN